MANLLSTAITGTLSTTGNIGIGTTNLAFPLTVYHATNSAATFQTSGTGTGAGNGFYVGHAGNISYVWNYNNFPIVLATNNTERLRITSAGNVGIGTTAPSEKLELSASGNIYGKIISTTTGGNAGVRFLSTGAREYGIFTDGDLRFYDFSASTERMRITWSGNVGIGTTSPSHKLHVNGTGRIVSQFIQGGGTARSTSGTTIAFTHNTVYSANTDLSDAGRFLSIVNESTTTNAYSALSFRVNPNSSGGGSNAMLDMKFVNANSSNSSNLIWSFLSGGSWTDRMALTSNGNVGIGTTSPQVELHVKGNNGWGELRVEGQTFASGHGSSLEFYSEGTALADVYASTSKDLILRTNGTTERMRITSAGNVGIGTTSPAHKTEISRLETVNRTTYTDILSINADANTAPYSGHGGGILFRGQTYSGSSNNNQGNRLWGRIGMYLNDSYDNFAGESMFFAVARDDRSDDLTTAMTIKYDGNVGIGTTGPQSRLDLGVASSRSTTSTLGYSANAALNIRIPNSVGDVGQIVFTNDAAPTAGYASIGVVMTSGAGVGVGDIIMSTKSIGADAASTERMRITSGGSLLIGDTTQGYNPQTQGYLLGVKSNTTQAFISIARSGQTLDSNGMIVGLDSNTGYVWMRESIALTFGTNNTTRATISAAGNVGIGTTAPSYKLHVNGDVFSSSVFGLQAAGTIGARFRTYSMTDPNWGLSTYAADPEYHTIIHGYGLDGSNRQFRVYDHNGGATRFCVNFDNGNTGIGTTRPGAKLDVQGQVRINTTATMPANASMIIGGVQNAGSSATLQVGGFVRIGTELLLHQSSANAARIGYDTSGLHIQGAYEGSSYNNVLIAESGGNVGIGTTSPGVKLDVNGPGRFVSDAASRVLYLKQNVTNGGNIIQFQNQEGGNVWELVGRNNQFYIYNANLSSMALYINPSNSNIGIGTTSPGYKLDVSGTIRATGDVIAYSDARVKENVETLDGALDKVMKMRGVSYNKIGEHEKKVGVIAQEVLEVLPEVVSQDETGTYSVAYGNITSVLIEAIKEQQKQIEELKAKLDGLTK